MKLPSSIVSAKEDIVKEITKENGTSRVLVRSLI